MPKSRHRKNHKKKVESWKQKTKQKTHKSVGAIILAQKYGMTDFASSENQKIQLFSPH